MSRVIKLNENQLKMLKEHESKKGTKLKITEDQLDRLIKGKSNISKNIKTNITNSLTKAGVKNEAELLGHPVQGDGSDYVPQSIEQNKKTTASFNESTNKPDIKRFSTNLIEYLRKQIKGDKTYPDFFKENKIPRKKLNKALRMEKVVRDTLIGEDRTIKLNKDIGEAVKRMYERLFPGDFKITESIGLSSNRDDYDSSAPFNDNSKTKSIDPIIPSEKKYTELFTDSRTSIFTDGKNMFYFDFQEKDDNDFEDYAERSYNILGQDAEGDYDIEYNDYEVDGDTVERFVNDNYSHLNNGKGPSKDVMGYDAMHDSENDFILLDDEAKKEYLTWFKNDSGNFEQLKKIFGVELDEAVTTGASSGQFNGPISTKPAINYGRTPQEEMGLHVETPEETNKYPYEFYVVYLDDNGVPQFGDAKSKIPFNEFIKRIPAHYDAYTDRRQASFNYNQMKDRYATTSKYSPVTDKPIGASLTESVKVSKADAKNIGDELNIDWSKIPFNEFLKGINVELEHGTVNSKTDVTNDSLIKTGKIALAHLNELPDYYTKLNKMEKSDTEVKETTQTGAASGQYSTPKMWAKSKADHKPSQKPMYPNGKIVESDKNFQTDTSYPDGEFVTFDKCVNIGNNDKTAINGGCSQGAVDGVVKTKKSVKSVISKEALYYEVALKTGKKVEEVREIIEKNRIK